MSDPEQRDRYDRLTRRGQYKQPVDSDQDHGRVRETPYSGQPTREYRPYQQRRNRSSFPFEPSDILIYLWMAGLLSFLFGLFLFGLGFAERVFQPIASLWWPAVPGKITFVEERSGEIKYTYNVKDQQYTSDQIYPDHGWGWGNEDYPVGSTVTVYYAPTDPANAVLNPGITLDWGCYCGVSGFFLAPGILAVSISFLRKRPWDWLISVRLGQKELLSDGTAIYRISERSASFLRSAFLFSATAGEGAILLSNAHQTSKLILIILVFVISLGMVAVWYFQEASGFDIIIPPKGNVRIKKAS